MRFFLVGLIIYLCFFSSVFGAQKQKTYQIPNALAEEIKTWNKEQLEYLSNIYLELGKQFFELSKDKDIKDKKGVSKYQTDSKACFFYAIQVYPIGKPASEAKEILKNKWNIIIP